MVIALFLMLFAIKHYLADKHWQSHWMVEGKRRRGISFVVPLAAHCGTHALLTMWVLAGVGIMLASPTILVWALPCVLFDFSAHFFMDRLKGVMTRPLLKMVPAGTFGSSGTITDGVLYPRSKRWMTVWMVVDQAFHVLTYIAIVAFLLV